MAYTQKPIEHTLKFKDRGGKSVVWRGKTNGLDLTASKNLLDSLVAAIVPLTDLVLTGYDMIVGYEDAAIVPTSSTGIGTDRAEFSVALVLGTAPDKQTPRARIFIPSPVAGIFEETEGPASNNVDMANANVQEFLALFTAGLGLLPSYILSDNQVIMDPTNANNAWGVRTTWKRKLAE